MTSQNLPVVVKGQQLRTAKYGLELARWIPYAFVASVRILGGAGADCHAGDYPELAGELLRNVRRNIFPVRYQPDRESPVAQQGRVHRANIDVIERARKIPGDWLAVLRPTFGRLTITRADRAEIPCTGAAAETALTFQPFRVRVPVGRKGLRLDVTA